MTLAGVWEKNYPWVGGLLFASGLWWSQLPMRSPDQLLNAAINVGGVLVGFAMTAKSILVALPQNAYVKKLQDSGVIGGVLSYLMQSAVAALLLVVVSVGLLAAPAKLTVGGANSSTVMAAWAGLALSVCLSIVRVTHLFGRAIAGPP